MLHSYVCSCYYCYFYSNYNYATAELDLQLSAIRHMYAHAVQNWIIRNVEIEILNFVHFVQESSTVHCVIVCCGKNYEIAFIVCNGGKLHICMLSPIQPSEEKFYYWCIFHLSKSKLYHSYVIRQVRKNYLIQLQIICK